MKLQVKCKFSLLNGETMPLISIKWDSPKNGQKYTSMKCYLDLLIFRHLQYYIWWSNIVCRLLNKWPYSVFKKCNLN
jgi:hypothetical protein